MDKQDFEQATDKMIERYQSLVGSIGFLRATRFDVLHALNQVARFATNPQQFHWKCLIHVSGYLRKNPTLELNFYPSENKSTRIYALTDAAFANTDSRYSTSGHLIYLDQSLVAAQSSLQRRLATSAPEAELYEIYRASKKLIVYKGTALDFGEEIEGITIFTDSQSSVGTINNPVSSRYRFLSIYITFLRNLMSKNELEMKFISRKQNLADVLTKQVPEEEFKTIWKSVFSPFKHVSL